MIDKFKIFNKVKIDTDKYEELETDNNEILKIKMKERLNSSQRTNRKRKKTNILISTVASIVIIVIGFGVLNPSVAINFIKNISGITTMLDKIKESVNEDSNIEYNKANKNQKLETTPINVSSKSNGLEITIDNAMYDKKKIYLDMILKTDKPLKESEYIKAIDDSPYGDGEKNMYLNNLKLYINGVEPISYGYGPGVIEFIDEYTAKYSFLLELDPSNDIDDANFNISFDISKYKHPNFLGDTKGEWSFDFNINAIDDITKHVEVNKKDGEYTLKSVDISNTYIEVKIELPFQPALGNPHNNFIIVKDDQGRELEMSTGADGDNKVYTQINELINIGEIPKYIDVLVTENLADVKPLSSFRVDLE